jgi:enoyl-[acyl-carrier protein] reductase II
MKKNRVCTILGIEYPIVQAPMVWITWAELAAAVSNAGGLGSIGPNAGETAVTSDVVETGERLRRQIRKLKSLTDKPFAVNLVIMQPTWRGLGGDYSKQCEKVIFEEWVPVVILSGDDDPSSYTKRLKKAGIKVIHRANPVNVDVAKRAEQAGVDIFAAVGHEGGGHIGTDEIPVIGGGGVADSRGAAAIFALGAEGIYVGTRFITTNECAAHPNVKQAIVRAKDTSTVVCGGSIGLLRAIKNPLIDICLRMASEGAKPEEISKFYDGAVRRGLIEGDVENGTLPCGAGAGIIKEIKSAADVVKDIIAQVN